MACLAFGDDLFGENGASDSRDFVSVDGGESFSVGVTQAGDIVGWGSSFHGELGHDEGDQPQRIRSLPVTIHMPTKCLLVACGLHHVLALDVNGTVLLLVFPIVAQI
jgi:alpha-tubulin suppressor-like RCC1 family protein